MTIPDRLETCRDDDAHRFQSRIFEQVTDWRTDAGLVNDNISTANRSTSQHFGDVLHDRGIAGPECQTLQVRHLKPLVGFLAQDVVPIRNRGSLDYPLILQRLDAMAHNSDRGGVRRLPEINANTPAVNRISSDSHPGLTPVRECFSHAHNGLTVFENAASIIVLGNTASSGS